MVLFTDKYFFGSITEKKAEPPVGYYFTLVLECWSDSIVDLGLWIADYNYEFDLVLIVSIRNLQSEIP